MSEHSILYKEFVLINTNKGLISFVVMIAGHLFLFGIDF